MSFIRSLANGTTLLAAMPQSLTNGVSQLGTISAPTLPQYLTDNPMTNGYPWGAATANGTNPYEESPYTGVIRPYHFTIARGYIAPDGVNKSVLLINGQFPGPTIEANWGDTIQVTVNNQISGPEEGTALHWHGLIQKETPWFDGVPSVQQCPIAPGSSFTYSFKADLYGTSWYHSHYSSQYAGGLLGPMIIHGPKNAKYERDLGPIFLTDWYHEEYFAIVQSVMANNPAPPTQPFSDNNLINGKMNFDCSKVAAGRTCTPNAGVSKFTFHKGKTHRLRLINASAQALQRFTIDNHTMTVIANDFVPVVPYETNMVTLGIGQRTDVLVKANGESTDAVWMRSDISTKCSVANQPHALAAIYYEKADTHAAPKSTATPYSDEVCGNDPLEKTVPYFPYSPSPNGPSITQQIDISFGPNKTGSLEWYMNNVSFHANYDNPLLLLANRGNTSYPDDPQWNVYNFGSHSSVRLYIRNLVYVNRSSHPMHMHGHNFWVLAEGQGEWDGHTIKKNPPRRDVQMLQNGDKVKGPGYMVIEFNTDNPGVWPFHCHIAWHVSAGLYINIMEHPEKITQRQIPGIMAQTCRDWANYTNHNVVAQIDSGL